MVLDLMKENFFLSWKISDFRKTKKLLLIKTIFSHTYGSKTLNNTYNSKINKQNCDPSILKRFGAIILFDHIKKSIRPEVDLYKICIPPRELHFVRILPFSRIALSKITFMKNSKRHSFISQLASNVSQKSLHFSGVPKSLPSPTIPTFPS